MYSNFSIARDPAGIKESNITFAVYYGDAVNESVIKYLNNFSMVILEPWAFNSSTLAEIRGIKIAYIDLGEYDNSSLGSCYINATEISLGYDAFWDQVIVNASSPLWQDYIMCEVKYVLNEGFNGVLFDDLDVVDEYPSVGGGIIHILNETKNSYPGIIIGVNRGFDILPNITKYIDFVMYEDYGTQVVSQGKVSFVGNEDYIIQETSKIRELNVTLLALAYAERPGDAFFNFSERLAAAEGIPLYVTNWNVTASGLNNSFRIIQRPSTPPYLNSPT